MATCLENYISNISKIRKKYDPDFKVTNYSSVDAVAIERIQKREADLQLQGRSLNDVNPDTGKTYSDELYNAETKSFLLQNIKEIQPRTTDDAVGKFMFDLDGQLKLLKEFNPKMDDKAIFANAIMAQFVETNYTYNQLSLEMMDLTGRQATMGDFQNRLMRELGDDFEIDVAFRDEIWKNDFINELFHMTNINTWNTARLGKLKDTVNKDGTVKKGTVNNDAHRAALAFVEEVMEINTFKLQGHGRNSNTIFNNKIKVDMTMYTLKEKFPNRTDFINFMKKHIDDSRWKKQYLDTDEVLAGIHDGLLDGTIKSWREIDSYIAKLDEKLNGGQLSRLNGIEYKDGQSFNAVNKELGVTKEISQIVLNAINYNSRQVALVKKLGPSPMEGFEKLKKIIEEETGGKSLDQLGFMQKSQLMAVLNAVESKIDPSVMEKSGVVPAFTILRRLQSIGKLGSAVITASLDVPVFLFTGKKMFGINNWKLLLEGVFNVVPFVGNKKAQRAYTSYVLEFTESWLDSASDRLGLVDSVALNQLKGGSTQQKLLNGSAWYNNQVFKLSGLNYWTRNLQAGGMYVKQFGTLISSKTAYQNIHERFRAQLSKYGVTESDWNFLLKTQPLDARGRLDLYQLGRVERSEVDNIIKETNIRDRLVAVVSDAVNTMVMKPNEFDRLATAFYGDESKPMAQVMKLVTQFKAQPISYTRKVILRQFVRKGAEMSGVDYKTMHKMEDFAMLIFGLTAMGAVQLQLKQVVAGKSPYDMTQPKFWTEVVEQAGYLGLLSDLPMAMGLRNVVDSFLSDEKEGIASSSQMYDRLLGPMIADTMKAMTGTAKLLVGAGRTLKGLDEGEYAGTGFSDIVGLLSNNLGFKNFIWTKMLYRKYLTEQASQWLNSKDYNRSQRRMQKEADETRKGQVNNWLYKNLP